MLVEERAPGAVRLDAEAFEQLAGLVHGGEPSAGPLADLLASGRLDAAVPALRDPLVRLRLQVGGPRLVQEHEGWVTRETAALLLAVHDDVLQLTAFAPQLLAAVIARVVRLGPRKVGERAPREVAGDVVQDLFHADDLRRASAFAEAGVGWAWTLQLAWAGGAVSMTVVDGEDGAHLVEDGSWLRPVSATFLWRRLTTALPTDDELP